MYVLKQQVTALLKSLLPQGWKLYYVDAKPDAPYPYLRYHVPSGEPDSAMGSFGSDNREYVISVQGASRNPDEVAKLLADIDDVMQGYVFQLGDEWHQEGRVTFAGIVPDPGNRLADLSMVYYDGNTYTVKVARSRIYVS